MNPDIYARDADLDSDLYARDADFDSGLYARDTEYLYFLRGKESSAFKK